MCREQSFRKRSFRPDSEAVLRPNSEAVLSEAVLQPIRVVEPPAKRHKGSSRRMSNRFECGGKCSKEACQYVGERQGDLDNHLGKNKTRCPECGSIHSQKRNMIAHYRRKHPENLNDDGSSKCHDNIPPKGAARLSIPESYKTKVTSEQWKQLKDGGGYAFLVAMVKGCLQNDLGNKRAQPFTDEELKYCRDVLKDNTRYHTLARDVLDYVLQRDMLTPGARDEAGGILPQGIVLRPHGGVFALGLDRRDNARPHFLKGVPTVGDHSNLRLVAKAINTRANVVVSHGNQACEFLRQAMRQPVTQEQKKAAWSREQSATKTVDGKTVINAAYNSCGTAFYSDELCRAQFGDIDTLFRYGLELWAKQGLLCNLSGILLQGNDCEDSKAEDSEAVRAEDSEAVRTKASLPVQTEALLPKHSFFKMSLDAIVPTRGHVRGNLQWVCWGLNSTNRDKTKRCHDENDPDSAWTRETLAAYLGIC